MDISEEFGTTANTHTNSIGSRLERNFFSDRKRLLLSTPIFVRRLLSLFAYTLLAQLLASQNRKRSTLFVIIIIFYFIYPSLHRDLSKRPARCQCVRREIEYILDGLVTRHVEGECEVTCVRVWGTAKLSLELNMNTTCDQGPSTG